MTSTPPVTVEGPTDADATAVGVMHLRSWHETYDGVAPGLDATWVEENVGPMAAPDADAFRRRVFAAQREDPARTFYRLARRGGEVVGFVHASLPREGDATLEALYLLRSEHGTGLADRLLTSALDWAGPRAVLLVASPLSVRAIPFYQRHGFRRTGQQGVYRGLVPTTALRRPASSAGAPGSAGRATVPG